MKSQKIHPKHLIGLTPVVLTSLLTLSWFCWGWPLSDLANKVYSSNNAHLPVSTSTLYQPDWASQARVSEAYGKLPLRFEANHGQTDPTVKFISRGSGYSLFLTPTEAVLTLRSGGRRIEIDDLRSPGSPARASHPSQSPDTMLRIKLVGTDPNPEPQIAGLEELPGKINYFFSKDPRKWRTNVPTYAQVRYEEVYPGIDLLYHGSKGQLEYDFIVGPGVDPGKIALDITGARSIRLDQDGGLILETEYGEVRQGRPIVYQEERGVRKEIAANYVLRDGSRISFQVAAYDSQQPLVIDPTIVYSTYLGGGEGRGVAVDSSGNAYVTGVAGLCTFVTKLDPSGTTFVYSTYLCGTGSNGSGGFAIAVDAVGNAYVAGLTGSRNFPTVNPLQPTLGGIYDAFVSKLDSSGSLIYSTYLGGSDAENIAGIAVDESGSAYVTGVTWSQNFPTVNAFQPENADHNCVEPDDPCELSGTEDVFVAKLNPAGSALVFSTYLGGMNHDEGRGIAVDPDGNAYITGFTQAYFIESTLSFDFPTKNAFQPAPLSEHSAFVSKFSPTGSLIYSTYLGGHTNATIGYSIAVDVLGSAYVTGNTGSQDFPTKNSIQGCTGVNDGDVFVTKLTPSGTRLVYSTCLGGFSEDFGNGIAVDTAGLAYVTGYATGSGYVWQLNSKGTALLYSSSLGAEPGNAIAVDNIGNAYIANSFLTKLGLASTFYYGLGDSVASGHGLPGDPGKSIDLCQRAPGAYPRIVGSTLGSLGVADRGQFVDLPGGPRALGCSGTRTKAPAPDGVHDKLFANQVKTVIDDLKRIRRDNAEARAIVSITVGVNDFPWASLLVEAPKLLCAPELEFSRSTDRIIAQITDSLQGEVDKLRRLGGVSVVLTTYHNPFNRESFYFDALRALRPCNGSESNAALYGRIDDATRRLNAALSNVALTNGDLVALADVYGAFNVNGSHEAPRALPGTLLGCGTAPPDFGQSWIQAPLVVPWIPPIIATGDCFHPNENGVVKYASSVVTAARRFLP